MSPEKRELCLAAALGLAAGPTYLAAGPANFLTWYAVLLGGGLLSTAFWLRDLKPSRSAWLTWLAWPFVMAAGAALSMAVCLLIQYFLAGGVMHDTGFWLA
ncbi:hypothetical membrane protein [Pelotomaculum thermopropionicum SI]|uniref:Hypothetical membrane protein n=1 Tax=Pelotomaculum thermopropionicum (strain DSM 13744 / JCM 10971 / SI) TaxID=370438 RepID=A5CZA7_PELTS|nr:hypothetical membrane protein [Pelotomaculum thermopropionicum SI]